MYLANDELCSYSKLRQLILSICAEHFAYTRDSPTFGHEIRPKTMYKLFALCEYKCSSPQMRNILCGLRLTPSAKMIHCI